MLDPFSQGSVFFTFWSKIVLFQTGQKMDPTKTMKNTSNIEISVVIPAFNAGFTLAELVQRCHHTLSGLFNNFEIIVVDDGSTDQTWELCQSLKKEFTNDFFAVRLDKNSGQHHATLCGLSRIKGPFSVTIDDDLEFQPEDISTLHRIGISEKVDVVYGIVPKNKLNATKRWKTNIFKQTSKYIEKKRGEGSSFRWIRRDIANHLINQSGQEIFIDELIPWYTSNIKDVEVGYVPSKKSRYRLRDSLAMTMMLSFAYGTWPLQLMSKIGMFISCASFLMGVYYLAKKIFWSLHVPEYSSLIVTIFFSTGIILLCLSALGYYLRYLIELVQRKPAYRIKEKI